MENTIIKWHDYSEISNYSYADGCMLFRIELNYKINGKKVTTIRYRTGGLTHPDNGTGVWIDGGSIVGMRILAFALTREFEDV